ncbi:VOC family protein [Sinorhizobium mexicanum]|uniref:VOC family protein n=1 Tax=Sinorhizobium mexicanum TaxID=375549 RepID=A0A859QT31_9HYPH|nr:VOC family protein [Sinorhizobium mexicanum]MBP1883443.1 putative 3-demethylubiquinone-9 3-methyltransferase (glyoxalase superfamily) [Sinorhizobium mexicanum]QLL62639.1 VOC family protein [Sinorhizobium mexicanum]
MQKITPFLWFDNQLEDAIEFYTSIFRDARVRDIKRGPDGKAFTATFELEGLQFMGLNGGPHFKFTEAISFFVRCSDQAEVDYYWDRLIEGGTPQHCGWLKDRYGVAWQIIPDALIRYLSDADSAKAGRVQQAMMGMVKLDVAGLDAAAAG